MGCTHIGGCTRFKRESHAVSRQVNDGLMTSYRPLSAGDLAAVLNLEPIRFKSTADVDDPDQDFDGLVAERVAEVLPQFVHYDAEGRLDGVQNDRIAGVTLLAVVKDHAATRANLRVAT